MKTNQEREGKQKRNRSFFGKGTSLLGKKLWDWETFETTKGFPVSTKLLDWVVGQDKALAEVRLSLDEWIYKLHYLQKERWYEPWLTIEGEKPILNQVLTPGPYLLLLGDPGTGKSLIGRAMAEHLTSLYRDHKIKRFDVLSWANKQIPSNPRISIHPAGEGRKIALRERLKAVKKGFLMKWGFRLLEGMMIGFGIAIISLVLFFVHSTWANNLVDPYYGITIQELYNYDYLKYLTDQFMRNAMVLYMGIGAISMGAMLFIFKHIIGSIGGGVKKGVGGAESLDSPKLLIENLSKSAPFVDATGHGSSQLYGCFDSETRLMTLRGLKNWNQLRIGELILSLDPKTEELVYQPIQKIFLYDYEGQMISLNQKKGTKFLLTPNHTILYRPRKRYDREEKALEFRNVSEINTSRFYVPVKAKSWIGKEDPSLSKNLLRFLGWYVSEGRLIPSRKYVAISQVKRREEVISLIKKMKIPFFLNSDEIIVRSKRLFNLCSQFGNGSLNKRIPRRFLELPRRQLIFLFETMMKGDGSKEKAYYTSSKILRDNFIELALKLGYAVSFAEDKRNPEKWNTNYQIYLSKKEGLINSKQLERKNYKGKIWCVTVPNHSILVEREGRFFFTSQSIAWDPYQEFSEDTYVLTPKGWKFIKDMKEKDLVVTLNHKQNLVETQPVKWTFEKFVNGEIVSFKNQHWDLLVDPNHAIFNAKTRKRERAGDFIGRRISFTRTANFKGKKIQYSDNFLKFLAWYISEGSSFKDENHRRINISQVKDTSKIKRIQKIIQNEGMKCSYMDNHHIRVHHAPRDIFDYVHKLGHAREKYIPEEIKNASKRQLRIFFEELIKGDGSDCSIDHKRYYTSSFRLCADVQEIALKLGWGSTLWIDKRTEGWRKNGVAYQLSFYRNGTFSVEGKLERYRGKMYCLGVPNGVIFVMRNGKPVWCGNTGGLGTPEHQRVTAGDVHRSSMGILYIDEIKNLGPLDAITLLTVMEDGCLPVTMRGRAGSGDTAAMAVGSEPIPALFFLLAAGNFDSVNMIHPALMDRLIGYGQVVRMNNDMPNTVKNRRSYIQFISQESQRFHLPPFSREACIELVEEGRRRTNQNDRLTTKFRPLISIIKTSGTIARNANSKVIEILHIKEAIEQHCKTIQKQLLEHLVEQRGRFLEIDPHGSKKNTIYGLALVSDSSGTGGTGSVLRVKGQLIKRKDLKKKGYYRVTGVSQQGKFIQDSAAKVRSVILAKYGIDIAQEYFSHIDFAQSYGVDGPSAGVTMTLLICALLENKKIRQDVAVTGEINIGSKNDIEITAVGGLYEKIKAAEGWGFKKVVIPLKNYKYSIKKSDFDIEVVGADSLEDYLREVLEDEKDARREK